MPNTGLEQESPNVTDVDRVHVAVGVVADERRQFLICRRPLHLHQGGLWEFPGGKVEDGESVEQALSRELREELGLEIETARPLIKIPYEYPDKRVLLDVWRISRWRGHAEPREHQLVRWVSSTALREYAFPAANAGILTAVRMPPLYLISPELRTADLSFTARLRTCLNAGVKLLQLRSKQMDPVELRSYSKLLLPLCREYGAKLLLNARATDALAIGADGVHLSSARLRQLSERPLPAEFLVGASCHNRLELEHALKIDADFVVISPVRSTRSHSDVSPLGWHRFGELANFMPIPSYALGGLRPQDRSRAFHSGAQGLSMISGIWSAADPAAAVRQITAE